MRCIFLEAVVHAVVVGGVTYKLIASIPCERYAPLSLSLSSMCLRLVGQGQSSTAGKCRKGERYGIAFGCESAAKNVLKDPYTPVRKDYMHKGMSLKLICRTIIFQLQKQFFLNSFPKNDITCIRLWFRELHGNYVSELFPWKIPFQLHKILFAELISLSFPTGV